MTKSMVAVVDQAIVGAGNFLVVVLLGRFAAPEELGIYSLGLSIVLLVRAVQAAVLLAPYSVYCHRHKGSMLLQYAGSTLLQQLLLAAVAAFGLILFSVVFWACYGMTGLMPAFLMLSIILPVILLREFARQMAFAHLELKVVLFVDLTVTVAQLAALVLLASGGHLSATSAFSAVGAACTIAVGGWISVWRGRLTIEPGRFITDLAQNWTFGKWALGAEITGPSVYLILPWLIAYHYGMVAAGMFAASNTIAGLASTVVLGLANMLTPHAAKAHAAGGKAQLWQVLRQFTLLFGVTIGPFAFFLLAFGGPVADFLYDGRYPGVGPTIAILAVNLLVGCLAIVAGSGLWVLHRPSASFWADAVRFAITLALAVWLIPSSGVIGAALAMLIGTSVGAAVNCAVFLRLFTQDVSGHGQKLSG